MNLDKNSWPASERISGSDKMYVFLLVKGLFSECDGAFIDKKKSVVVSAEHDTRRRLVASPRGVRQNQRSSVGDSAKEYLYVR